MKTQIRSFWNILFLSGFFLLSGCALSADMAFFMDSSSEEEPVQETPGSFANIPGDALRYSRNFKYGAAKSLLVSSSGEVFAHGHSRGYTSDGSVNLAKFDENLSRTDFSNSVTLFKSNVSLTISYGENPYQLTQDSAGRTYLPGSGFEASADDDLGSVLSKVEGTDGAIIYRVLANGNLDTSFSGDGIFLSTTKGIFHQVLPLTNGKLFAVGADYSASESSKPFAVYLNQDGTIDESFDEDGLLALWSFSSDEGSFIRALEQDVSGEKRILILTRKTSGSDSVRVYRYKLTGEPDLSFGAGQGYIEAPTATTSSAVDFYLGDDGKISIFAEVFDDSFEIDSVQVSRHLSDGSLDTSFDTDGFVRHSMSSNTSLVSAVMDTDGQFYYLTSYRHGLSSYRNISFEVCKLTGSGAKENSFGSSGCLSLGSTSQELNARDLAVGSNGYVYVQATYYNASESNSDLREKSLLLRIDKNSGVLDTSVGASGLSYYQSDKDSTRIWSSVVLPTNAIINVVEDLVLDGGHLEKRNSNYEIDATFAANISAFRSNYSAVVIYGVFLGNQRLLATGYDDNSGNTVVMAFSYEGVFDSSFGVGGFIQLPDVYSWGNWQPPIVDSLGRLVIFGAFTESGTPDVRHILVNRYLANGTLDSSFDGDGKVDIASLVSDYIESIGAVTDSSNGVYIYVTVGSDSDVNSSLIHLDSSGVRDISFAGSGIYQVSGSSGAQIQSLLAGPAGELYLAIKDNDELKLRVRKLTSAGVVDTSFGTSGEWESAETYLGFSLIGGMAFDNRTGHTDKILVYSGVAENPATVRKVQVHRLTSGGLVDTSFGTAGVLSKDVSAIGGVSLSNFDYLYFSLASDGSIFAAFTGYSPVDGTFVKLR